MSLFDTFFIYTNDVELYMVYIFNCLVFRLINSNTFFVTFRFCITIEKKFMYLYLDLTFTYNGYHDITEILFLYI